MNELPKVELMNKTLAEYKGRHVFDKRDLFEVSYGKSYYTFTIATAELQTVSFPHMC